MLYESCHCANTGLSLRPVPPQSYYTPSMIIFVTNLTKGEVSGYLDLHSVLKLHIVIMNHSQRPNNSPSLSLSYLHHPRFCAIAYFFLAFAEFFSHLKNARYFYS